ncbi:hypothetical protein [Phytoactinopolyspora mesophila]|uniref:Uncharacterized protein n=1 Tax=Phytoactinopolyspora mesophila TaxID=2650750 RepID=A0A7K3M5U9_9ACTN|nr:hypothetical protein [Phytoactinopolyspora mesophila]NDL58626.1 hypothetical protein [Phytoactinopolyspora mesophila]
MIHLQIDAGYEIPSDDVETRVVTMDAIEEQLIDLEAQDPSVRDSTVTLFGSKLTISLFASGQTETDALQRAWSRLHAAIGVASYDLGLVNAKIEPALSVA